MHDLRFSLEGADSIVQASGKNTHAWLAFDPRTERSVKLSKRSYQGSDIADWQYFVRLHLAPGNNYTAPFGHHLYTLESTLDIDGHRSSPCI